MMANILDRAVAWISPERGLARARARAAAAIIDRFGRRYDAANVGRRTDGWVATGASANAEIGPALALSRARSRDLERNNPWARRGIDVLVGNIVGTGIVPTPRGRSAKRAAAAYKEWMRHADFDGRADYYGVQALALRTAIVSGESLTVRRWATAEETAATGVRLRLQVLEGDFLDAAKSGPTAGGGYIVQGVEFSARGRRVAYWMFDEHPGEVAVSFRRAGSYVSQRVPAADVVHLYRVDRPGQVRGMPWLAPVMLKLRDIADYDEAEIVRKKLEACVVGIVTQEDAGDGPGLGEGSTAPDGKRIESFEPGMYEFLRPGEDIKFNNPTVASGTSEHMRGWARVVASGLGVMYEQLTGDLSTVNYSSYRAGDMTARRLVEMARWTMMVPTWCDATWGWFVEAARLAGQVPDAAIAADWTPPKFESVDPVKDAEADLLDIRMGTKSWRQAVAERGYDPEEQLATIAAHNAALDAAKVILDSDPRHQARSGNRAGAPAAAEQQPAKEG